MIAFIVLRKPLSFNARKKNSYLSQLLTSKEKYVSTKDLISGDLYGLVYHFYREELDIDADNLSKPVWDALKGSVYEDDSQVKLRIALSRQLTGNELVPISVTPSNSLSVELLSDLQEALQDDQQTHILYVECGKFNPALINFGLESNADQS